MFYKITLKPIANFYFGGENSFGDSKSAQDASKRYFSKRAAYFAQGEMFPQQTQILGMLRKTILRKHGCLRLHNNGEWVATTEKQNIAKELVGAKWEEWSDRLGKIIKLTHVHLEESMEGTVIAYHPAPYDKDLTLSKEEGVSYINGRKDDSYVYAFKKDSENYFGAKDDLCFEYISSDARKNLDLNKVFTNYTKTGNQTFDKGDNDEEQLYKISSYVVSKEHKHINFVCYLESDDNTLFGDSYNQIVELGGERSLFELNVINVDAIPEPNSYYKAKLEKRIVLTSDTYIVNDADNKSIFDYVDVALAQKIPFRTFSESRDKDKYNFSKSGKKILLKKGSVFYPNDDFLTKITDILKAQTAYRKIGYNQFVIIDKKEG